MLRLVPFDKEKNEESKVENILSSLYFLQLIFFSYFHDLKGKNLIFPKTGWFHKSVYIIAKDNDDRFQCLVNLP